MRPMSRGTAFYEFRPLGGGAAASTMGDMKKIKEWYREGMNAGVSDDRDLKGEVLSHSRLLRCGSRKGHMLIDFRTVTQS